MPRKRARNGGGGFGAHDVFVPQERERDVILEGGVHALEVAALLLSHRGDNLYLAGLQPRVGVAEEGHERSPDEDATDGRRWACEGSWERRRGAA